MKVEKITFSTVKDGVIKHIMINPLQQLDKEKVLEDVENFIKSLDKDDESKPIYSSK